MTKWINIKDELPPIGKKVVITRPDGTLCVITLGLSWHHDDGNHWPETHTEEMIKLTSAYWYLLPEPPK